MAHKPVSLPSRYQPVGDSRVLTFVDFLDEDNGASVASDPSRSLAIANHVCRALRVLVEDLHIDQVHAQFSKNDTLKSFISTYVMHRMRPHEVLIAREEKDRANNRLVESRHADAELGEQLMLLDRLVFLTALRLVTPLEGTDTHRPSLALVQTCPLLQIPTLASLFCLAGDSNVEAARVLMDNLVCLTGVGFVVERVAEMMEECRRVADLLVAQSRVITGSDEAQDREGQSPVNIARAKKAVSLTDSKRKKKKDDWEADSRLLKAAASAKSAGEAYSEKEGRGKLALSEAHRVALLALDTACCLCALLDALPPAVALHSSGALLSSNGGAVCDAGMALLHTLQALHDSVIPALESSLSSPLLHSEKGEERGEERMVRVVLGACRGRLVRALLRLTLLATYGDPLAQAQEGEEDMQVGWEHALHTLLQGQARGSGLVQEAFKGANSGDDGDAGGGLFPLEKHLLGLAGAPEDKEAVQYIFAALAAMRQEQEQEQEQEQGGPRSAASLLEHALLPPPPPQKDSATTTTAVAPAEEQLEAVQSLHAMFEHLSEGQCFACLDAFDFSTQRAADALLTDNLPPAIANIVSSSNRTVVARLDRVVGDVRRGVREREREKVEKEERERDKARLVAIGRREEQDRELLLRHAQGEGGMAFDLSIPAHEAVRRERQSLRDDMKEKEEEVSKESPVSVPVIKESLYEDDYDDQYDDAPVAIPSVQQWGGGRVAVVEGKRSTRKEKGKARESKREAAMRLQEAYAKAAEQQEEVRRVNVLLREREEEELYWRGLDQGSRERNEGRGRGDEGGAMLPAPVRGSVHGKQQQQQQQQQPRSGKGTASGAGAGAGAGGGKEGQGQPQSSKPRTKTFDKHHQKSKALKRGDVFKG